MDKTHQQEHSTTQEQEQEEKQEEKQEQGAEPEAERRGEGNGDDDFDSGLDQKHCEETTDDVPPHVAIRMDAHATYVSQARRMNNNITNTPTR